MKTLRALGALLAYPDAHLRAALPEILGVLAAERHCTPGGLHELGQLVAWMQNEDPFALEEAYGEIFDRGRATSLHLFEHVHGDSRDRGQAMVDLKAMYERAGLALVPHELPDYLPALLEYLSLQPASEIRETLADCAHVLRAIGERLAGLGSLHAAVFAALLEIAGEPGLRARGAACPTGDPEALDREWAEAPAFGPGAANASCSAAACGRGAYGAGCNTQSPRPA